MSGSVVFYRFKAQKEPSTVQFEGTGISVWDLKKEILAENKLGKGADFDFAIYNSDTNEEYSDDKAIVPRSTSVIARRLPPSRPGRGNAQNYMASSLSAPGPSGSGPNAGRKGNMSQRFDFRNEPPAKASTPTPQPIIEASASTGADEASKIAAMFANTDEQWKTTQEKMSNATYYGFRRPGTGAPGGSKPPQHAAPDKPVPPGYVCYRCGQPGHWIQDCPTNSDPDYRNKPRIKRTTGIPKSFLQTVEGPAADGENQAGLMVTADGNFVIARPDAASWEKHRAVTANLTSNDIQNAPPTDPDLTCPLCNRLLRDAVKTPCCSTSYCEECIHNYLSENDFVCPECESKVKSLKNLVKDEDRRERAKKYLEDTLQASKAAGEAEKAEKEKVEKGDGKSDNGDNDNDQGNKAKEPSPDRQKPPTIRTESLGPAEEGELAGDEAISTKAGTQSPRSQRASSMPRSDGGASNSKVDEKKNPAKTQQAASNGTRQGSSGAMGNMNMTNNNGMGNNMMSQGQMNNMFDQFNSNIGGARNMPPQMQMLQNQMQGTMQMLQNPNLPPPMRMQLSMQLQQLQYTFGQMMNMMNNGYGNPMQMQMAMYAQAQQLAMMQQQQQYAMMQGAYGNMGGQYGYQNGGGNPGFQRTGQMNYSRHASQFEEDSADSPYMRVPTNPKFKNGKRDRPEDFYSFENQPYKR